MKLDVEFKEDKINSLTREVADLENRGADQEEVRRICFEELLIFVNNYQPGDATKKAESRS